MMAGGVESWSSSSAEGEAKLEMVMEFSLDDGGVAAASFSSSPKLPRKLRRRLSEPKTPQKRLWRTRMKVAQTKKMLSKQAVQTKEILSKQAVKFAKQ
ncbi:t-complex protein 11-like protein 1 [Fagus crenata]